MTLKRSFALVHTTARANAARAVMEAPDGWLVTVRPPTRTSEQNALMWALLSDLSRQVEWHGHYLTADDWKNICTASLRCSRVVPGIDAGTLVPLGLSTSSMGKGELSDLIELIYAFGASKGVAFHKSREQYLQDARLRGRSSARGLSTPDVGADSPVDLPRRRADRGDE
jgi:hypothetical protein